MAKILIVDDDADTRLLLDQILAKEGYQVIEAEDGRSACERAVSEKPDVILLDIVMPAMDGFDTLRRLKDNPDTASIPVIFVTAKKQLEDEIRGTQLGAFDFICKPLAAGELEDRTRMALTYLEGRTRSGPQLRTDTLQGEGGGNTGNHHRGNDGSSSPMRRGPLPSKRRPRPVRATPVSPPTGRVDQPKPSFARKDLEEVARRFIQTKYSRIRGIKFTSITESGPSHGLNVYKIQGVTTVLMGNLPSLQAKGFHLTVYVTRDGRVLDRQGRVM